MNAPRYANDAATVADGFGPSRTGDQVARIALEADPPFTVCVAYGSTLDDYFYQAERSRSLSLLESLSFSESTVKLGKNLFSKDKIFSLPTKILLQCGLLHAARDYFAEQAEDAELARRRGQRPGEPLPRRFAFFDKAGRLRDVTARSSFVELRKWVDDDEAVLAWTFPEDLAEEEREVLLADLAVLRRQPWSPQAAIDALLADWPEEESERDVSFAEAERRFAEACEAALAEEASTGG